MEAFIGSIDEGGETFIFEQAKLNLQWRDAMALEYQSNLDNHTWDLVKAHPSVWPILVHWLYKIKPGINDGSKRYKARFVARGFQQ